MFSMRGRFFFQKQANILAFTIIQVIPSVAHRVDHNRSQEFP